MWLWNQQSAWLARRAIAARRLLEIDRKRDKAANVLDEAVRIVNVP
jgi:hypothetical protein